MKSIWIQLNVALMKPRLDGEEIHLNLKGYNFKLVSLPNSNKTEGYIGLFDNNNEQIHEIQYHKNWYKMKIKKPVAGRLK